MPSAAVCAAGERLAGFGGEVGAVVVSFGADRLDGDLVAEALDGCGVAAGAAADVGPAVVVVGSEVVVDGVGLDRMCQMMTRIAWATVTMALPLAGAER